MKNDLKSSLLQLAETRYDTVTVEGQTVRIREIGTLEFARYGELSSDQTDAKGAVTRQGNKLEATAYLIASCVVDDEGNPVLDERSEGLTLAKNARVSMPIVNKLMELSGFREVEEKHSDAG